MNEKKDKIENNEQDPEILKLFDEGEDIDQLILEHLSEEEAQDLQKAGFRKEQIAYVAKEKMKAEKQGEVIINILDLLPWILPW